MTLNIRRATPADFKILQKLNKEVFLDNAQYDKYLSLQWPFSKAGERYYRKVLSRKLYECFIAEANGKPVGYLAAKKVGYSYRAGSVIVIENMGVVPEHRSKGIESLLINSLRSWCKKEKIERIFVNAYVKNIRAIRFYQRHGLTPIDISLEGEVEPTPNPRRDE